MDQTTLLIMSRRWTRMARMPDRVRTHPRFVFPMKILENPR